MRERFGGDFTTLKCKVGVHFFLVAEQTLTSKALKNSVTSEKVVPGHKSATSKEQYSRKTSYLTRAMPLCGVVAQTRQAFGLYVYGSCLRKGHANSSCGRPPFDADEGFLGRGASS